MLQREVRASTFVIRRHLLELLVVSDGRPCRAAAAWKSVVFGLVVVAGHVRGPEQLSASKVVFMASSSWRCNHYHGLMAAGRGFGAAARRHSRASRDRKPHRDDAGVAKVVVGLATPLPPVGVPIASRASTFRYGDGGAAYAKSACSIQGKARATGRGVRAGCEAAIAERRDRTSTRSDLLGVAIGADRRRGRRRRRAPRARASGRLLRIRGYVCDRRRSRSVPHDLARSGRPRLSSRARIRARVQRSAASSGWQAESAGARHFKWPSKDGVRSRAPVAASCTRYDRAEASATCGSRIPIIRSPASCSRRAGNEVHCCSSSAFDKVDHRGRQAARASARAPWPCWRSIRDLEAARSRKRSTLGPARDGRDRATATAISCSPRHAGATPTGPGVSRRFGRSTRQGKLAQGRAADATARARRSNSHSTTAAPVEGRDDRRRRRGAGSSGLASS